MGKKRPDSNGLPGDELISSVPFTQHDDDTFPDDDSNIPAQLAGEDPHDPKAEFDDTDDNDIVLTSKRGGTGSRRFLLREPQGQLPTKDGATGGPVEEAICHNFAREWVETGKSLAAMAGKYDLRQRTGKAILKALTRCERGGTQKKGTTTLRDVPSATNVRHSKGRKGFRRILLTIPKRPLPTVSGDTPVSEEMCRQVAANYVAHPEKRPEDIAGELGMSTTCVKNVVRALVDTVQGRVTAQDRPAIDARNPAHKHVVRRVVELYASGAYTIVGLADSLNIRPYDVFTILKPRGMMAGLAEAKHLMLVEELQATAGVALERIQASIDRATPYQAAIIFGIVCDKMQVLLGQPSEIKEQRRGFTPEAEDRMAQLQSVVDQAGNVCDRLERGNAKLRVADFAATRTAHQGKAYGPRVAKRKSVGAGDQT